MEADNQILGTLLKHMPSSMKVEDIEQLLQEIPVQLPPAVVPVRTMQEAVAAGDKISYVILHINIMTCNMISYI
jgi:hypothetical protein